MHRENKRDGCGRQASPGEEAHDATWHNDYLVSQCKQERCCEREVLRAQTAAKDARAVEKVARRGETRHAKAAAKKASKSADKAAALFEANNRESKRSDSKEAKKPKAPPKEQMQNTSKGDDDRHGAFDLVVWIALGSVAISIVDWVLCGRFVLFK